MHSAWIRPTHSVIRFQLPNIWSTTLRSPIPERATGGRPTFALKAGEGSRPRSAQRSLLARRVSTVARQKFARA